MSAKLLDADFERWAPTGPDSECWLWTGPVYRDTGYGRFGTQLAHRKAWERKNGEIAPGLFVCHRCDVRLCVNTSHMFLGTAADNNRDMFEKKRHSHGAAHGRLIASGDQHWTRRLRQRLSKGERHYKAKLTADDVRWIRWAYAYAAPHRCKTKLARIFGVTTGAISALLIGKSWKP